MDELTKLIDQMVQEKTFSMEGVAAINELREQAELMQKTIKQLQESFKKENECANRLRNDNDALKGELKNWRAREEKLTNRESKITELEKDRAVANAKADTFRECVGLVFRNTTVRENMVGTRPVAESSGFVGQHGVNEDTTKTEE